jgi:uncharacterized protein YigA (DUF484 family)
MTADDVAEFLKTNPQFFAQFFTHHIEEHPELLESLYVPHPYGGRAIPLSERQMVGLREKARVLEGKLGELIQFGEENDAISEKVHRLAIAIAGARDFPMLTRALYFHLREDFAVPHVALRIWGKSVPADLAEAEPVSETLRREAESIGDPRCGPAAESPFAPTFGEAAAHVRSLAIVPLGETSVFGALLLGSEDAKRFYAEMGTLYLRRIGELLAAGIGARL